MKSDLSPADLSSAIRDLSEIEHAAIEEDDKIPSKIARRNALRLLRAMYDYSPQCYQVYPLHDGEVTIDAPSGYDRSVAVVCESDGSVLCMANFFGRRRYARYSDASSLPDQFMYEALSELRRRESDSI